ncbi:hypothetical protein C7388_105254 [Methylobacterium radiotolerans]|nr:hypothetical protein C7388_105254 [Methylobacterium organophilum]
MRPPIPDLFTRVGIVLPDHIAPRRPPAARAGVSSDPASGAGRPDRQGAGAEVADAVSTVPPDGRGRAPCIVSDSDR